METGGWDRTDAATGLVDPETTWNPRHENFQPLTDTGNANVGVAEDVGVGVHH